MRKTLVCLCLLAAASYACAQAAKPATGVMAQQNKLGIQRSVQVDPVQTLQRQVARLQGQVRELRRQMDLLIKDANAARNSIPKCSDDLRESFSPSGRRSCEPYACDPVVGTCLMSCATTNDCSPGTVCDMEPGRCVHP